ncbi:MAG TPA: Rieske (2Fe-2S) protein, partial [Steroidobacteraceae bacterium]|nr:Rieske (2Fe-2S) protein [Steroidobacteraceae bacterium]
MPSSGQELGIRLCRLEELPDRGSRGFDPFGQGHDTLFVVREGGAIHAWMDSCPHLPGTSLAWRKDAYLNFARDRIVCGAHGALFDIASGICLLGPCLGQALERVPAWITDEGWVHIRSRPGAPV